MTSRTKFLLHIWCIHCLQSAQQQVKIMYTLNSNVILHPDEFMLGGTQKNILMKISCQDGSILKAVLHMRVV